MKNNNTHFLQYITVILILAALAFRAGATFDRFFALKEKLFNLEDVQKAFPKAHTFTSNSDKSFSVYDEQKNNIGKLLCSSNFEATQLGYNGDVPILIAVNDSNQIAQVVLLANQESPEFIGVIYRKSLLDSWNGLSLDTSVLNKSVDAVSGATFSSNAITTGVKQTLNNYFQLTPQHQHADWKQYLQLVLFILLILSALLLTFRKEFRKYYYYHLAFVVVIVGFWAQKMLSLDLFNAWLANGLPWKTNIEMIIILLLTLCLSLAGKKNFYCNYLCPMGALQLITAKISPLKKRQFPKKIFNLDIRLVYLCFIWSALILGVSLPLNNMEPFISFIYQVTSVGMIIFGLIIVVLSVFFNRPWCAFCPTGCALNILPPLKAKETKTVKTSNEKE
ncbi:MAG: FMN-binding protein [Mangrovibacterium sp.]